MKKQFLAFLLLTTIFSFAQTTIVNKLQINSAVKQNGYTRVLVQDSITKKVDWVLKSSLGGSGGDVVQNNMTPSETLAPSVNAVTDYIDGGVIFKDEFNTTVDATYTAVGSPTYSFGASGITLSGGSGNFSKYLSKGYTSSLENNEIVCDITPTVNGSGFAIGYQGVSSFTSGSIYAYINLNATTNRGQLIISSSTAGTLATSASNLTYTTSTDDIRLIFRRNKYSFEFIAVNLTDNSIARVTYAGSANVGAVALGTIWKPSLYAHGGTQIVQDFTYSSNVKKGAKILWLGDSITNGMFGGGVNNRFSDIFASKTKEDIVTMGARGAESDDLLQLLPEIISLKPQNLIFAGGINDVRAGVTLGAYQTNINTVIAALLENNIVPIFQEILPTSNSTHTSTAVTWNAWLATLGYKVLAVHSALSSGGVLNPIYDSGDGVHINALGMELIADIDITELSDTVDFRHPDFTFSSGLTLDNGVVTNDLSTGVSGGQTINGGTASGNSLTIQSTTNATKGSILLAPTASGEVWQGTTTPNPLPSTGDTANHLWGLVNEGTSKQMFSMWAIGSGAGFFQNNMHFYRSRGTIASPTAVQSGDFFKSEGVRGYNGTIMSQSQAAFQALANENWSSGAMGTRFQFEVTAKGSGSRIGAMSLDSEGLSIGNPTSGDTTTGASVDVWGNNILLGSQSSSKLRGNSTDKTFRILAYPYTNANGGSAVVLGVQNSTANILYFGGGSGNYNAATQLNFYTAANNNTKTGTVRFNTNSSGNTYFGGSTSGTAKLHVGAGTATASTAPLKLTSGTNLTTPEAGAIEYDGTNYFATDSANTRYILTRTLTGTTAPSTTPTSVGVQFVDTVNAKIYVSTGTSSSADWTILN